MVARRIFRTYQSVFLVLPLIALVSESPSTSSRPSWAATADPPTFDLNEDLTLLRVQFDNELLVHRRRLYIFATRQRHHARLEILAVNVQPRRHALALRQVARLEHHGILVHLVLEGDLIAHLHKVARNVQLLALHSNVTLQHELAGLRARAGKTHAVNHIIQPAFEH